MKAEMIERILMILTDFILEMLGTITFLQEGNHKV